MSISAMKQALEALVEANEISKGPYAICLPAEIDTAMDVLRQAIEQAEKQEPAFYVIPATDRFGEGYEQTFWEDPAGFPVYTRPVYASDISQECVDETAKREHEPVAWLDNGLGVFYWASEFNDRPVPPGFEPLYAAQPRTWSDVTDDALIEEVRYRGFTIRDAQISDEYELCCQKYDTCTEPCTPRGRHLAKREWVGLTDGDIAKTMHGSVEGSNMLPYQFARAIEAKLKAKNCG